MDKKAFFEKFKTWVLNNKELIEKYSRNDSFFTPKRRGAEEK